MRVAKWGNSLAVLLPPDVVEALCLKEGDDIQISVAPARRPDLGQVMRRTALARLRRLRRPLPPGFRFSREGANER
jgi:antitoxin MazE